MKLIYATLLLAIQAHAQRPCFVLLRAPVQQTESEFSPHELNAAETWLKKVADSDYPKTLMSRPEYVEFLRANKVSDADLAEADPLTWPARFVLTRWREWNSATIEQRAMARALEFSKLRPKSDEAPTVINGQMSAEDMRKLSAQNLQRLLMRLEAIHPTPELDTEKSAWIRQTVSRLRFLYLRAKRVENSIEDIEPALSGRDLNRIGLEAQSFYSELLDSSPSVGFRVTAVDTKFDPPQTYPNLNTRDVISLDTKWAGEEGFVMPDFNSAEGMMKFFDVWEPRANESVFRANRFHLPQSVRTYEEFRSKITVANERTVFTRPYEQLSALRVRLGAFAMTASDARIFLSAVYAGYLSDRLRRQPQDRLAVEQMLAKPGGLQLLFRTGVLPWIGLEQNLSLRIPITAPPAKYGLLRAEKQREQWDPYVPFHQGHRVDHRSMP